MHDYYPAMTNQQHCYHQAVSQTGALSHHCGSYKPPIAQPSMRHRFCEGSCNMCWPLIPRIPWRIPVSGLWLWEETWLHTRAGKSWSVEYKEQVVENLVQLPLWVQLIPLGNHSSKQSPIWGKSEGPWFQWWNLKVNSHQDTKTNFINSGKSLQGEVGLTWYLGSWWSVGEPKGEGFLKKRGPSMHNAQQIQSLTSASPLRVPMCCLMRLSALEPMLDCFSLIWL